MSGEPTSLHDTRVQRRGAWRDFGAFVRRPQLPAQATGIRAAALPVLGRLFALDLLLMALLIVIALGAAAAGIEIPAHVLDDMAIGAPLVLFMLLGAPIGEELLFRSWLSGKSGHVAAFLLAFATLLAATAAFFLGQRLPAAFIASLGAVLAAYILWRRRGRPPLRFFARHFRWFYLGSTLAFASMHLTNFSEGAALILLPLTLPQFLLGLILGYVRVKFGMWANVLFHAAHNSIFVGLILLGAS